MNLLCLSCQKMLTVPEEFVGQLMICPLCRSIFTVPGLPGAAPPPSLPPSKSGGDIYSFLPEPEPPASPPHKDMMPMNEVARRTLAEIIARHLRPPELDVRRCEGLLRDLLRGENRKEINVLVSALRERIVDDLMASSGSVPTAVLLTRCAHKLHDQTDITEELARWSVESWALALGAISPDTTTAVEKTTPTVRSSPQVWYYSPDDRKRVQTVSLAELEKLVAAKQLSPDHMVWKEGMAKWVPANTIEELSPATISPSPPSSAAANEEETTELNETPNTVVVPPAVNNEGTTKTRPC